MKLIYCKHNSKNNYAESGFVAKENIFNFNLDSFCKHFEKLFLYYDNEEYFEYNDVKIRKKYAPEIIEKLQNYIRLPQNQNRFREDLMDIYKECPVTGVNISECLIASHIVSWSDAYKLGWDESEIYDINNGFMFFAGFDCLFDRNLVSFDESGKLFFSPFLIKKYNNIDTLINQLEPKIKIKKILLERDEYGYFKNSFFDLLKNNSDKMKFLKKIDFNVLRKNLLMHFEITKKKTIK